MEERPPSRRPHTALPAVGIVFRVIDAEPLGRRGRLAICRIDNTRADPDGTSGCENAAVRSAVMCSLRAECLSTLVVGCLRHPVDFRRKPDDTTRRSHRPAAARASAVEPFIGLFALNDDRRLTQRAKEPEDYVMVIDELYVVVDSAVAERNAIVENGRSIVIRVSSIEHQGRTAIQQDVAAIDKRDREVAVAGAFNVPQIVVELVRVSAGYVDRQGDFRMRHRAVRSILKFILGKQRVMGLFEDIDPDARVFELELEDLGIYQLSHGGRRHVPHGRNIQRIGKRKMGDLKEVSLEEFHDLIEHENAFPHTHVCRFDFKLKLEAMPGAA